MPLDVYFFQRRRHDCRRAFSLLESVHRIISPVQTIPTLQTYPESCYISRKTKAARLPPIPLDVYLFPKQTARLPQGVFSTRICASNRSASVKPIRKAATSHAKQKRQGFPLYRLMFIFCQRRRHDCCRTFSLPESVHRIAPPASSLFGKLLHPRKAKRYSFHPYRLMFIFSQHRRHGCHMAFSLPESVH